MRERTRGFRALGVGPGEPAEQAAGHPAAGRLCTRACRAFGSARGTPGPPRSFVTFRSVRKRPGKRGGGGGLAGARPLQASAPRPCRWQGGECYCTEAAKRGPGPGRRAALTPTPRAGTRRNPRAFSGSTAVRTRRGVLRFRRRGRRGFCPEPLTAGAAKHVLLLVARRRHRSPWALQSRRVPLLPALPGGGAQVS